MFKNAKVGDRVWSIQGGWGKIKQIAQDGKRSYPVIVSYANHHEDCFTFEGLYNEHNHAPSLFWDDPQIISPPPPKKLVTKTLKGWVNVYPDREPVYHMTLMAADEYASPNRIACCKFSGTYEIYE